MTGRPRTRWAPARLGATSGSVTLVLPETLREYEQARAEADELAPPR